tara:strand:- start:3784 stop:4434 length:651 start_codon:yes stop_codon:yes gene_type:complete
MILNNLKKRFFTSFALLAAVFIIFKYDVFLIYFLILGGVFSILEFASITITIFNNRYKTILINFIFIFYISSFCILFFIFTNILISKTILFIILLGCVASDIGGFIFGKIFKGPKLTKISPNKTVAGAIGSLILCTILISVLFIYLLDFYNYKILVTALITSIFCQIGDLLFSLLKRKANLKDTGKILPGHGGILDRLDGIFLGLPFGLTTLILLN